MSQSPSPRGISSFTSFFILFHDAQEQTLCHMNLFPSHDSVACRERDTTNFSDANYRIDRHPQSLVEGNTECRHFAYNPRMFCLGRHQPGNPNPLGLCADPSLKEETGSPNTSRKAFCTLFDGEK